MRVYQLIYTSVQHSLSDNSLGLANQPGLRVYSCTQGITKENIGEIIKFASYRLPKNDKTSYSEVIGDPKIPEMFPKSFRTLHLSDGRYAAVQSVYSGVDFQGQPGNFFAHALVFEEPDADFFPEQYFKSSAFKTYLTTKEAERELVHYLPPLDGLKPEEDVKNEIASFIGAHKKEMSYLLEKALETLVSDTVVNMCVSAASEELTADYLLSLKWLLPRDISLNTGISTYNIYIPSDRQKQIVFNGTIKGKNNITKQAVETRTTCIYIDMEQTDFSNTEINPLLEMNIDNLRREYGRYNFSSVTQLNDWLTSLKNENAPGIGAKLLNLKASAGNNAFALRVAELYEKLDDASMSAVRFEVLKAAYDNLELFEDKSTEITEKYVGMCVDKLCRGENYDIYDLFADGANNLARAEKIKKNIPEYIDKIKENYDKIGEKNKYIFLILFARIKQESGGGTWKEFFGGNKERLRVFVEMSSMIITGSGLAAFSPPSVWTRDDLDETVAYFEASTQDDAIKASCVKYICSHDETDWEKYGIMLTKHKKTTGEEEKDMRKIKRMLSMVGYIPYYGKPYDSLRREVAADMENASSPLLLSRLLTAYYTWRDSYGNQAQSEKAAMKLKGLILELQRTEKSCYDYVFPKLGLEITESPGHYHEQIINTETVTPAFWNWFIIGFKNSLGDDDRILNYTRVYEANKRKLMRMPVIKRLREVFSHME